MKTCIKVYGPPVIEAVKALEKVAVEILKEMPKICFYDVAGGSAIPLVEITADITGLSMSDAKIYCQKLISKSGWTLGDFYFEWASQPTIKQLQKLISKIDEVMKTLGCKYTITTK